MENWEKQRRLDELERLSRENNQVLEDSNRIEADKVNSINEQNRLIAEQNKLLEQRRWDEERRRQRESEERAEQGFKDRIFNLRTKIAEATDAYQEAKLQALLTEAIAEEEAYYEDKRRREEESRIRAEKLEQERLIKEQIAEKMRRRKTILKWFKRLVFIGLTLFIGFLALGFWANQRDSRAADDLSNLFANKKSTKIENVQHLTSQQEEALSDYMASFGQIMGQSYQVVTKEIDTLTQASEVAWYSEKNSSTPTVKTISWNDLTTDLTIVAAYDQTDNAEANLLPISYRFLLVNTKPVVALVQREAQYHQFAHPQTGNILLPLHPTENADLQSAFEKILAGQAVTSPFPAPYAETEHTSLTEFTVDVTVSDLNIRQEPSLSAKVVRAIPQGTYTIVETTEADGHTWGKLKSGEGWISLDMIGQSALDNGDVKRIIGAPPAPIGKTILVPEKNTKDLTTEEVAHWVKAITHATRATPSGAIALEGMSVDVWMADDGLVYADLTATGFPFVDEYRINKNGYLEFYTTDGKGDWQVVSEVYTYIQP